MVQALGPGKAEGRWLPSREWQLHSTVYLARDDADAVIHHHGTFASAVAVALKTIPVSSTKRLTSDRSLPRPTRFEQVRSWPRWRRAKWLWGNAVLPANHGAVVVGGDLKEALRRALEVERLAKIYIGAELLGGAQPLDEAADARSRSFFEGYRAPRVESRSRTSIPPHIVGYEGLHDLVSYSFRAGMTFASLVQALIFQKLHRSP